MMTLEHVWHIVWGLLSALVVMTIFLVRLYDQHRKMYRLLYGEKDEDKGSLLARFRMFDKLLRMMVRTGADSDPQLRKVAQKLYPRLLDEEESP